MRLPHPGRLGRARLAPGPGSAHWQARSVRWDLEGGTRPGRRAAPAPCDSCEAHLGLPPAAACHSGRGRRGAERGQDIVRDHLARGPRARPATHAPRAAPPGPRDGGAGRPLRSAHAVRCRGGHGHVRGSEVANACLTAAILALCRLHCGSTLPSGVLEKNHF